MLPGIRLQAAAHERPARMGAAYLCMAAGMALCFYPAAHDDEALQLRGMLRALGLLLLGFLLHPGSRGQSNVPVREQCCLVVGMARDVRGASLDDRVLLGMNLGLGMLRAAVLSAFPGPGKRALLFNALGGGCGLLPYAIDRAWGRSRVPAARRLEALFPAVPVRYRQHHLYDTSVYHANALFGGAILQLAGILLQSQLGLLAWRTSGMLRSVREQDWRFLYPAMEIAAALPGLLIGNLAELQCDRHSHTGRAISLLVHAGALPLRYLGRTPAWLMGAMCGIDLASLMVTRRVWEGGEDRYPAGFEVAPIRMPAEPAVQRPRIRANHLALTIHPAPMPGIPALGYYHHRGQPPSPDRPVSRSASRASFAEDPPPSPPRDHKMRPLTAAQLEDDEHIRFRQRLEYFGLVHHGDLDHWLYPHPAWQYPPPPFPKPEHYLDYPWHPGAPAAEPGPTRFHPAPAAPHSRL